MASPVTVAVTGTAPAPATTSRAEVIGGKGIEALAFSAIRLPTSPLSLARSAAGQNVHIASPVAVATDRRIKKPADLISSFVFCLSFAKAVRCSASRREVLASRFRARSTSLIIRVLCRLVSASRALPTASALASQAGPVCIRLKTVFAVAAGCGSARVAGAFCSSRSIGTGYGSISLVLISFRCGLCSNR